MAKPKGKPAEKPPVKPASMANRIVGHAMVKAKDLKPHPLNPRLHPPAQRAALTRIMQTVGWIDQVIVNKRTGLMLNGHLRREIAAASDESVPVTYVDLSSDEETMMLATYDPVGDMAIVDDKQLAELLAQVDIGDNELGALLDSLLKESADAAPREDGPPRESRFGEGVLGNPRAQIKPVLYASQIDIFERALIATGKRNRADALIEVCDFYLTAAAE